ILGISEHDLRPDDAGVDGGGVPPKTPAPETCKTDGDCKAPTSCYTAHCDVTRERCSYALCESARACAMGECDVASGVCGAPRDYGLRTPTVSLPDIVLGCGRDAVACAAAVFPFFFVGTSTDTVAFVVDDLLSPAAHRVALHGAALRPTRVLTS